jgi:hypothetical protein
MKNYNIYHRVLMCKEKEGVLGFQEALEVVPWH